jgi:hypothetical protein
MRWSISLEAVFPLAPGLVFAPALGLVIDDCFCLWVVRF